MLEALLYTLKMINADQSILPGVKLGVLALDSCDSTAYALEQTMDFIKVRIAKTCHITFLNVNRDSSQETTHTTVNVSLHV